jgi:hypothetical protein
MAYFTDEKDINEGEFQMTMDTVEIEVENPTGTAELVIEEGDLVATGSIGWHVRNTGRQPVFIRVKIEQSPGPYIDWDIVSDSGNWKRGLSGDEYYYLNKVVERNDEVPVTFDLTGFETGTVTLTLIAEAVQEANQGYEAWEDDFPFEPDELIGSNH